MAKSKQHNEIIAGLDIGSSVIRVAVGQYLVDERGFGDLQVMGTAEVPSEGIQRGTVTSIEEAVSSISHALEQTERLLGLPVDHAWVGVSGGHILTQQTRGVVAVAKSDGEISEDDVARVVEAARTVAAPLNYDVLHIISRSFVVDGQTGIKDPTGMTGVRLEVDAQIIYGATPHLKNIMKAVYRTGIDIDDLVLSVLAASDLVLTPKQKDLGVAVVDIGGSSTTIVVYEQGNIIHTAVLPIGGDHVTNDLALGLQTSIDIAEKVKILYGQCISKGLGKKDTVHLSEVGAPEDIEVPKQYIVEIIEARVGEILEKVNAELMKIQRQRLLPAGVVFTGGGAKILGLTDLSKHVLGMNASLGYPLGIRSATDKVNDIAFATAIGLVKWGAGMMDKGGKKKRFPGASPGKMIEQVQKLFKFLIP